MNEKEKCLIYDSVNKCETLDELANVILQIGGKNDTILGRTRSFKASNMAAYCKQYHLLFHSNQANLLTREFGLRQQAIYILYYTNKL